MAKGRKPKKPEVPDQVAVQRDGTIIRTGDRVSTNYHPSCIDQVFVVELIYPWDTCESRTMVIVHLESDPTRKLQGEPPRLAPEGHKGGIDANWLKKIDQ